MPEKLLLCTDLDRTLIPNGTQPESVMACPLFRQFVAQPEVTLAYVTGRHLALVLEAIATYGLPQPDFIIADVGTSLYEWSGDDWGRSPIWDEHLAADWQGKNALEIAKFLQDIGEISPQELEKQGLHKLSYYVELDESLEPILEEIQGCLNSVAIQANLIWSIDEEKNIGLLDLLPKRANKYEAIAFLMKHQEFSPQNTIFAGDSGNDRDVLISDIPAVLVANAQPQLKADLELAMIDNSFAEKFYIAKGNFYQLNGNYSAGILEGICHYYPTYQSWIEQNFFKIKSTHIL